MLPTIFPEQLVHESKFWDNGSVHRGMRYGQDLYRWIASFPLDQSQPAYSLGIALCERNQSIALTKSSMGYTVWSSLRSGEAVYSSKAVEHDRQSLPSRALVGMA